MFMRWGLLCLLTRYPPQFRHIDIFILSQACGILSQACYFSGISTAHRKFPRSKHSIFITVNYVIHGTIYTSELRSRFKSQLGSFLWKGCLYHSPWFGFPCMLNSSHLYSLKLRNSLPINSLPLMVGCYSCVPVCKYSSSCVASIKETRHVRSVHCTIPCPLLVTTLSRQ